MLRHRQHNDLVLPQNLRSLCSFGNSGTRDTTQSALSIVAVGYLLALFMLLVPVRSSTLFKL